MPGNQVYPADVSFRSVPRHACAPSAGDSGQSSCQPAVSTIIESHPIRSKFPDTRRHLRQMGAKLADGAELWIRSRILLH